MLTESTEFIKFICEIITSLTAVISAIIVLLTLREMQIQRNNAYMPDLIIETLHFIVTWGDTTEFSHAIKKASTANEIEVTPARIKLHVRNIGVGVAKKLSLSITTDNYISWLLFLKKLNPEIQYSFKQLDQSTLKITKEDHMLICHFGAEKKPFLLDSSKEVFDYEITNYTDLLCDIALSLASKDKHNEMFNIPDLKIRASFEDVQGKKYNKEILLKTTFSYISFSDCNGYAPCQIEMK